jgi:hypothetical protein
MFNPMHSNRARSGSAQLRGGTRCGYPSSQVPGGGFAAGAKGACSDGAGRLMAGDHPRNTTAMRESPRCGARTRSGLPCRAPAVTGKKRCRMHGGTAGSGAPRGNQNALKHGRYTSESRESRALFAALRREMRAWLREHRKTR